MRCSISSARRAGLSSALSSTNRLTGTVRRYRVDSVGGGPRTRGRVVAAAVVAAVAAALVLASAASAAFPGRDGKLAFSSFGVTGDYDIFTHDGRRLDDLTPDNVDDTAPAWSADGRRIAWERWVDEGSPEIFAMDADGGSRRQVTRGPGEARSPAWAPGGGRIAYYGAERGPGGDRFGLFVVALDGSRERYLGGPGFVESEPAWSPDGRRIAVASKSPDDRADGVYLVKSRSGARTRLTNGDDTSPTWSPDGRRLAFVRFRRAMFTVHVVRRDGSGVRALPQTESIYPIQVRWSPDGRTLSTTDATKIPLFALVGPSLISPCCVDVFARDGSRLGRVFSGGVDHELQPCSRRCRPLPHVDVTARSRPPRRGVSFKVDPRFGAVRVRPRGARRFRTLRRKRTLRTGSTVDVTAGGARVTIGIGRGKRRAVDLIGLAEEPRIRYFTDTVPRSAVTIDQTRRGRARTVLRLRGGRFGSCPRRGGSRRARTRVVRAIHAVMPIGRGGAFFQTIGRYSSMEPRSVREDLRWMLEDRCDGTRNIDRDFSTWVIRDRVRGGRFLMRPETGGATRFVRAPRGSR